MIYTLDTTDVNRIEIINHTSLDAPGREFVKYFKNEPVKIEISMQDDNQTMKIFISRKEPKS